MSNELSVTHSTGNTIYLVLLNTASQVYNTSTTSFETPQNANWANYAIAATEAGTTGIYRGDMPSVAAGIYYLVAYKQSGGSPAVGDSDIGEGAMEWDGSAEIALNSRSTFDSASDTVTLSASSVDAILDDPVDGSYTLRQILRLLASALAGKVSGGGTTTVTFRDLGDSKDRIVATVDSSGNRTAITLDAT